MVEKHLPGGADIHGGGTDLRFPHHENELAQSDAAHPDRTFVRAWAHHGLINIASGKMAKSLGNILEDRKSTRLNSSHANISYAVFCLKKKKQQLEEALRDVHRLGV